ncbi:MAG: hypothetical protein OXT01_17580, partial [Rhodospirillaceae bacterium]|nr:hypothetical protein [Rhodospirillaceae bacterium]
AVRSKVDRIRQQRLIDVRATADFEKLNLGISETGFGRVFLDKLLVEDDVQGDVEQAELLCQTHRVGFCNGGTRRANRQECRSGDP